MLRRIGAKRGSGAEIRLIVRPLLQRSAMSENPLDQIHSQFIVVCFHSPRSCMDKEH
jgi:hypothetical protein